MIIKIYSAILLIFMSVISLANNKIVELDSNYQSIRVIKILEKPIYSDLEIEEFLKESIFQPDVIGNYVLEDSGNIIKIKVVNNKDYSFENNIKAIDKFINSKDLPSLELAYGIFKKNNPSSIKNIDIIVSMIDLYLEKNDKRALILYRSLSKDYKITGLFKEKILNKFYTKKDFLNKKEELEVVKELYSLNPKYKLDLIKTFLYLGGNEKKIEKMIVDYFNENYDEESKLILVDLLIKKRDISNLIGLLIETRVYDLAYYLAKNEKSEELNRLIKISKKGNLVEKALKDLNRDKMLEKYLQQARDYSEQERYDASVIYYKKYIGLKNDYEVVLELFNLYEKNGELGNATLLIETYLKEKDSFSSPEMLTKLGLLYHRLKKNDKSVILFNRVIKEYPKTIWANRSKIYIKRLK